MTRKPSSLIRRDIDSNDIAVEDLTEMLTSHEDINKKVAHRRKKYKEITAMVANTSQIKGSKGIATTVERGPKNKRFLVQEKVQIE